MDSWYSASETICDVFVVEHRSYIFTGAIVPARVIIVLNVYVSWVYSIGAQGYFVMRTEFFYFFTKIYMNNGRGPNVKDHPQLSTVKVVTELIMDQKKVQKTPHYDNLPFTFMIYFV